MHRTPRTFLAWATLPQWHEAALALGRRPSSAANNRRMELHVAALPLRLIEQCSCPQTLALCRDLLRSGPSHLRQPLRGQRARAPQTALIVAINNRLFQLERASDLAAIPDGHNSRNRPQRGMGGAKRHKSRRLLLSASTGLALLSEGFFLKLTL